MRHIIIRLIIIFHVSVSCSNPIKIKNFIKSSRSSNVATQKNFACVNARGTSLIDICIPLKARCRINNRVRLPSFCREREKREHSRQYNLLIGVLTISRLKIICDRWRVRLLTNTFSQFRRALSSSWHTCSNTSWRA